MSDFEITDEIIDVMLKYLQLNRPELANREFAENWLRYWKAQLRETSLQNLNNDKLDKMLDDFLKSKGQNI
jgi:hypothetical protein